MGAEIRAFIETVDRTANGNTVARCCAAVYIARDYWLFGALAGVRSDEVPPTVAPRGLPLDRSYQVDWEYGDDGRDAHTASWLSRNEVQTAVERLRAYRSAVVPSGSPAVRQATAALAYMRALEQQGLGESRLVFWFVG